MNTKRHIKTYILLIIISLGLEATRVTGAMTETLIFLLFVMHEFASFYMESNPKLATALAPIPFEDIDPKWKRNNKK